MRLHASLRMKASREFALLRAEGTTYPGRCIVLQVRRDPSVERFRFGLITGRKIGKAVTRVRVRRLLREVVRTEQEKILSGIQIVIVARWRAPEATLEDLRRDFLGCVKRAGLLQP
jgi:ribonuclease P protein component